MTYEIGKIYTVPTVYAFFSYRLDTWPVLGPKHEDVDHIGFPYHHYHFDFRFMNKQQWDFLVDKQRKLDRPLHSMFGELLLERPELNQALSPMVYQRRKCQREMPEYPLHVAHWLPKLKAAYAGKSLVNGHICPHRGADLAGLPVAADGCITCPLHGLRFNAETGLIAVGQNLEVSE